MRKHPALLCVDGNNIVHRSFHAYANQDIRDAQGRPAGAIYGLLVTLDKAIRQAEKIGVPPTHLLVAFDPRTCWRHDQYPAYKAGRSETDADLRDQLNRVGDVLTACGIPNACVERYEADDVLASVVTACAAAGGVSVVLSGDRDLLQLVSADALVLAPLNGGELKVMNRAAVTEKYSVDPDRYLDLAALRGDKSDNLPGVSGIGPVKATALIDAFGS
ncbi:MAG: DNA polymerase I, partial [Proteobacteria bacterium]|nr:DNA polymerase I [Pseudomonadota bacterium]